jgi:sugar-specific transcriptional regulator TrmB
MKSTHQKLSDIFGLSHYEARVFVALSGYDKANITQIAKTSDIRRTAIYPSIKNLLAKGLISIVNSGKRKYYKAVPSDTLTSLFEMKKGELGAVVQELANIVPASAEPLQMMYFPGKNGMNTASEIFLKDTKSKLWRTFENAAVNHPTLDFYQFEDYINRRVKKGIKARVIVTLGLLYPWLKERMEKNKEELRETLLVSGKIFSFGVVLGINEDSVLVLSADDITFGAIIKSAAIARTLATLHDMLWLQYKGE